MFLLRRLDGPVLRNLDTIRLTVATPTSNRSATCSELPCRHCEAAAARVLTPCAKADRRRRKRNVIGPHPIGSRNRARPTDAAAAVKPSSPDRGVRPRTSWTGLMIAGSDPQRTGSRRAAPAVNERVRPPQHSPNKSQRLGAAQRLNAASHTQPALSEHPIKPPSIKPQRS